MKKRFFLIITGLFIIFGGVSVGAEASETGEWAAEAVKAAQKADIADNEFFEDVDRSITRGDFCELVYRLIDNVKDVNWKKASPAAFIDTDNEMILALRYEGIVFGKYDDGRSFASEEFLTREEAAAILHRVTEYIDIEYPDAVYDVAFVDDEDISQWARQAAYDLYNLGIMVGTDKGFEPKSQLSAEQAAAVVMRIYDLCGQQGKITKKVIEPVNPESFSDKLYEYMPDDRNYIYSPFSVKMALALAVNGASGDTGREIAEVVGIENIDEYNESAKEMTEKYSRQDIFKLEISNSVWINKSMTDNNFSKEYTDKVSEYLGAEVGEVTKDNALDKINGWVNEKTHGKISSVIDNNLFEAMLINAVYFKARWAGEFSREATRPDIFTNGDGTKSETDFMNKTARLDYCEFNGIQIVELPYANYEDKTDEEGNNVRNYLKNFNFSMYLLMSDEEFSPEYILNNALPLMKSTEIQLSMPKFVIEYSANMNDILMNLGIDKAFTPQAEFYNMFDGGNMFITGVIHKAYIDVNERETEAAAVTAVHVGRGAAVREKPPEIKFNKPFTFVIRDNISGETLFVGEYAYVEE